MKKVVVLDFDGTLTDAEAEAKPFRVAWESDLSARTGIPLAEVHFLLNGYEEDIVNQPTLHAWEVNGHSVAPACVDPYIRAQVATRMLFDSRGFYPDKEERERIRQQMWNENYPKSDTVFRPGARTLLDTVCQYRHSYIVTNSKTDNVLKKLVKLKSAFPPDRVLGDARKSEIDPHWTLFRESLQLPGLDRPVLLRRKRYFSKLTKIRFAHDIIMPKDLTFVGDIFELDLALAHKLRCRVGLLANEFTPPHEIAFLEKQPNARVLWDLTQALKFILEG